MVESKNVQIPLSLFNEIACFFEILDVSKHSLPGMLNFNGILLELRKKRHKINLHVAYTKAVQARDETQRQLAHAVYLKLKNKL